MRGYDCRECEVCRSGAIGDGCRDRADRGPGRGKGLRRPFRRDKVG